MSKESKKKDYLSLGCVCGVTEIEKISKNKLACYNFLKKYSILFKFRIRCFDCGVWQHPKCVNYDIKYPYKDPFKCPHCLVTSVIF